MNEWFSVSLHVCHNPYSPLKGLLYSEPLFSTCTYDWNGTFLNYMHRGSLVQSNQTGFMRTCIVVLLI